MNTTTPTGGRASTQRGSPPRPPQLRVREEGRRRARRNWILGWAGASVLGVANGVSRETLYADAVGDEAAHLISTGTLLALLVGYMWWLQRRWPLEDRQEALSVGGAWAAMTVVFEFAFGHWVDGDSWSALVENYDMTAGKVWVLVPVAMLAGPELARRLTWRGDDAVPHAPAV
jgi:hypothetical protein